MQSLKTEKHRNLWSLRHWALGGSLLALAAAASPVHSQQLNFSGGGGGRAILAGSVLLDGEAQPASRVRVDVQAIGGTDLATTFTDAAGRFQAPVGNGTVIVRVREQGYEPVEQRVDTASGVSGLVITLRKLRVSPAEHQGYTVSVRDLRVPSKARHAFEQGVSLLQKKDLQGGLNRLKEATDVFPDYFEAYYQIGLAELELRRGNDAEQALQRAIDLSGGGYADPQFALGALLCDRQSYADAERVLRRAIEVDPNSWKGHLFLGQALFGLGRFAEAEKSANEVLLRRPEVSSAYILLANIHIRRHEYILGVKDLDTFLEMKPTGPASDQARAVRAASERLAGRLQAAIQPPRFVY